MHIDANDVDSISLKQCRQAKISYSGKFMADVCFQYNDGAIIREKYNFGQFPVMLKVGACICISVCVCL